MAIVKSLSGLKDKITDIGTNLATLSDFGLIGSAMQSGLKPAYRITTSEALSEGLVTDVFVTNTIPDWVDVKSLGDENPRTKFDKSTVKSIWSYKANEVFQEQLKENAAIGILMDESPKNIYRYLVDIIFTNVPYESTDGVRKMLAEDFLPLGFPIQVSTGFIDVDGNFRRHPYEEPISTYGEVPPDFTGILGAITQETFTNGDFFQGTFVGFEYLLERFNPQEEFPIKSKEPITRTLARLLRWLATRSTEHSKKRSARLTSGDATIGIPILRAMGVMDAKGTKILATEKIRKNIILLDLPRYGRRTRRHMPNFGVSSKGGAAVRKIDTFFTFKAIMELIGRWSNTDIYFNEYGRLTVSGKPRVREIATNNYDRIRVHDAIIGSNVIHHQATIDLSQIVNRVVIHNVFSGINAASPTMVIVNPNKGVLIELDDVTKYYAHSDSYGPQEVYNYEDISIDDLDPMDVAERLIEHFRYYGMRGTCFMIGNPKIRVGDVIRVSDIRSFGITGMNDPNAVMALSKEMQWTIEKAGTDTLRAFEYDPLIEKSFRLKTGIDHFFIWKVVHYMGPDGFKTKVFYTKERDSYRPGSDLLAQHIRRRRRGIAGEFK